MKKKVFRAMYGFKTIEDNKEIKKEVKEVKKTAKKKVGK